MSWYHADMMAGYYAAREAQEMEAEAYSNGYAIELAEFYERTPRITFRTWLIEWSAGFREAMA